MKYKVFSFFLCEAYPRVFLWIGLFWVALVYGIFLLTGDMQEDFFITLRTALNFADHGELSFNLGENYSGATSYLYPLWIALIRKAAGDFIIPAILIVNSLAVLGAGYLFANFISLLLDSCKANVTFLNWIVIALTPIAVVISIRGMPFMLFCFLSSACKPFIVFRSDIFPMCQSLFYLWFVLMQSLSV